MDNAKSKNYRLFLDSLCRLIVGDVAEETDTLLKVKNPLILHTQMQPGQNGQAPQLSIQFFPVLFREFQGDKEEDAICGYNKATISIFDHMTLDARLLSQINNVFSPAKYLPQMPAGAPPPAQQNQGNVIKLFDN